MHTIHYNSSRWSTTHANLTQAVAILRAQWPDVCLYEVDGEPGRALAWENKAAMEADTSGGGTAVAEIIMEHAK